MGILGIISAFVGITSLLWNIGKSIDDSQEAKETNEDQKDLAEKQLKMNTDVANQNYALSKEQFEYQKQLNNIQMEREDSAFQRQVEDLKKAGLSPLMVAGNGATSNPLTSATAPQFDISGINQAMSSMISAYNDSFNRKMQSRQFALQSKVQTAQAYTQLAETYMQQKKANLENYYLSEKLKWEKEHGFRDYKWQSELTNILEKLLGINPSGVGNGQTPPVVENIKDVKNFLDNEVTAPDNNDFSTYGSVPRMSRYGHMLDNENYDNDRSTGKYIKEELKEKKQKIDLKIKDNEKNRINLYDSDDYLKKHISKENWLKANKDFIKYYLKYGHFEGHKTYFE